MAGYQYAQIIGNVGRDPELRYTQDGVAVCDFSVAVNRTWTDKATGEKRTSTKWYRVTAWRRLAEVVNQYVHKGMLVMVAGEPGASAYIAQDGKARATLELRASEIQFLGGNGESGRRPEDEVEVDEFENEDLPF